MAEEPVLLTMAASEHLVSGTVSSTAVRAQGPWADLGRRVNEREAGSKFGLQSGVVFKEPCGHSDSQEAEGIRVCLFRTKGLSCRIEVTFEYGS